MLYYNKDDIAFLHYDILIKKAVHLRGSCFRNETEKHFSEISISGCSFAWPQTGTYSTARLHLKDKSMSKGRKYNTSKTWHVAVYKDGEFTNPHLSVNGPVLRWGRTAILTARLFISRCTSQWLVSIHLFISCKRQFKEAESFTADSINN